MSQPFGATSEAEAKALVRDQLSRILASPLFSNSKRFPAFLRFTVEHALTSAETLKERTVGHEAFGRDPGYDTSQDPIVRMAAAEVRKRLVQYYQEPEHAAELHISYQPGSYLPEFSLGAQAPNAESGVTAAPSQVAPQHRSRRAGVLWVAAALAVAVVLVTVVLWPRSVSVPPSSLARFWQPILGSSAPVLLCIGDPFSPGQSGGADASSPPINDQTISEFLQMNSVRFTDSVTLAMIAGELRAQSKPFRIRRPASTDLKDLREGPVILIGGFNNPWTVRFSEGLRFTLSGDERGRYILDRDRPADRQWNTASPSTKLGDLKKTYGMITRVKDPATGDWVMIVSGLVLGTRAAAECALDAECLARAESSTSGWDQRNIQIVVSAAVVGEDSGAPTVIATHVW